MFINVQNIYLNINVNFHLTGSLFKSFIASIEIWCNKTKRFKKIKHKKKKKCFLWNILRFSIEHQEIFKAENIKNKS